MLKIHEITERSPLRLHWRIIANAPSYVTEQSNFGWLSVAFSARVPDVAHVE